MRDALIFSFVLFCITGLYLLRSRLDESEARIQSLEAQVQSLTSKPNP